MISEIENSTELWEVIVKYNGSIMKIETDLNAEVEILNENYSIITLPRNQIMALYDYPEVEYIEMPKLLTLNLSESTSRACIPQVQAASGFNLLGNGAIVAVIDSGIDYQHTDFRNDDGTSRILYLWDQTASGAAPPLGFKSGIEYTREMINTALENPQPFDIVPELDEIGHGTGVAGIAAGNGRQSQGRERGAAPQASLVIVKLGQRGEESFTRTTELMRAIKYCIDRAQALLMPVAINISYGTNNGSHDGNSLFENYIDEMSLQWKCVIVVASGNEGASGHHFSAQIAQSETMRIEFTTTANLSYFFLTLWKNFVDTFTIELIAPNGTSSGIIPFSRRFTSMYTEGASIYITYGQPTHYSEYQEIYIQFISDEQTIPQGIWVLNITGTDIVDGRFDIWLPTTEEVSDETAFTEPAVDSTLTIPSTAKNVISVGGYEARINSTAVFSGRGYTRNNVYVKPDLVAPANAIISTRAGGGYDAFTGTSFAAPFVTGSAALMMEWGIVRGNDPFLYGQRVKAFLQKGATRDETRTYPNPVWGYGTLCLKSSMDLLVQYVKGG